VDAWLDAISAPKAGQLKKIDDRAANRPRADLSRAGLLNRLDERIYGLEMDRIKGLIPADEYREIRAIIDGLVASTEALPA
jgi:hypothetical protein